MITGMRECKNVYHKVGNGLISGISPTANNTVHIHCDFHPNCCDLEFVNCLFIFCDGTEYLANTKYCVEARG